MLLLLLFLCGSGICVTGPTQFLLPAWRDSYSKNLNALPENRTGFLSADQNDLVLLPKDSAGRKTIRIVSLNKRVVPHLSVSIAQQPSGQYKYLYTISNGREAHDAILHFFLVVPAAYDGIYATSNGEIGGREWSGGIASSVIAPQCEIASNVLGRYAFWVGTSGSKYELGAGQSRSGLGLRNSFRPGFTTAYISGQIPSIPEDWDVDYGNMGDLSWNAVHIPALGPMFSKTATCNEVLANYHEGLSRLMQCGLSDSDKAAASSLLAQIDNSQSKCSSLKTELRTRLVNNSQLVSDVLNALRLTLESY